MSGFVNSLYVDQVMITNSLRQHVHFIYLASSCEIVDKRSKATMLISSSP